MSAQAMLEIKTILNIQPGEIPPIIHLKEGSDAVDVVLRIKASSTRLGTGGKAILKGNKPDGRKLFVVLPVSGSDADYIDVDLVTEIIKQMTDVAGEYGCTITIIDSDNAISETDYEDYDCITVQPFTTDVERTAGGSA